SFRSPDWLRDEWAQGHGLAAFRTDEYTSSLDAVYERLGVNLNHSRVSARERVLERGLRQLGWHVGYMPRNVQGCTQDESCGFCGYGCQIGAKQSTLKTYLMDAYRRRARIVVNCTVDRVLIEGGRAVGVRATVRQPEIPALLALVTPWRKPDHYRRLMRQLPNLSLTGILLRDSGSGRVTSKDGTSRVDYRLSRQDLAHMRKGIEVGVRVLEAAGAREIFTSQSAYVAYRPGQRGGVETYMSEVDRNGYGPGQMGYVSFHQMGSCRMGNDPATSVVGPDHQAHAVKGLFVADGSAFPSASGVNPMITIMAMAHRASRFIASAC